jgi:hypothetical protein
MPPKLPGLTPRRVRMPGLVGGLSGRGHQGNSDQCRTLTMVALWIQCCLRPMRVPLAVFARRVPRAMIATEAMRPRARDAHNKLLRVDFCPGGLKRAHGHAAPMCRAKFHGGPPPANVLRATGVWLE